MTVEQPTHPRIVESMAPGNSQVMGGKDGRDDQMDISKLNASLLLPWPNISYRIGICSDGISLAPIGSANGSPIGSSAGSSTGPSLGSSVGSSIGSFSIESSVASSTGSSTGSSSFGSSVALAIGSSTGSFYLANHSRSCLSAQSDTYMKTNNTINTPP